MSADLRSQLRAIFERDLPAVLDRASGADGLVTDRLVLDLFSALLRDPEQHQNLLGREAVAQREWLLERVDDAPALEEDAHDPAEAGDLTEADDPADADDCVRSAAAEWVAQYFDGALAPSAEAGLWAHLDDCAACRSRYGALRVQEGEGGEGLRRRTRRLARGLPWSAVPDAASNDESDARSARPGGDDPAEDEQAPNRRFWLTRKGRRTAYGIAIGLFVVGQLYLVFMPQTREFGLQDELPALRGVEPLPRQGLSIALLRYQPQTQYDMPWQSVQVAVAAGDRLLLTYSLDVGKKKALGRPRFLTIVAVDDKGRVRWLRPTAQKPGLLTSPPVAVPARAEKLPTELRAPQGVDRLVIYAVVTEVPVRLTTIGRALAEAFARTDFVTTPPPLNIDHSLQYHLTVDVLR